LRTFIAGVTGQLGYDTAKECIRRGHQVVGSGCRPLESIDMRLFVTGVGGQLGRDSVIELEKRGHQAVGSDIQPESTFSVAEYVQLDITDAAAVKSTIERIKPDAIIHCAAWTAVEAAEDEANWERVEAINHFGTQFIAEVAKSIDAKMLYISTDYVFDGQGETPWQPDCKEYAPLNYYGVTKLQGEQAVTSILERWYVVRIAWVFGNSPSAKNFIKTMINVGKTHDTVRVVNDQIGTPTYTADLARLLADMIETEKYGYYHATNSECEPGAYISWADLAEEVYKVAGMDVKVNRVTTAEYGASIAARPFNSRLDKSKLEENGFKPLPDWKDAVARYIREAKL